MVFINSSIIRFQSITRRIHSQHSSISSILIGPAVKLLILRYNLDLTNIKKRSGPKRNILKSDILNYISNEKLSPISLHPIKEISQEMSQINKSEEVLTKQSKSKKQNFFEIPLSDSQKQIIKEISNSKLNIPHEYASINISTLKIKKLLNQLKIISNIDLSIESFIIYSCAQTLKLIPEINVYWNGDNLKKSNNINISFLSQNKNLILFNFADQIDIELISKLIKENKYFKYNDYKNTFSISNLSNSVSKYTTIINLPQTSILTIGSLLNNNELNLTLCYDARAIKQEDAHKFLNILNNYLSEPNFNLFLNLSNNISTILDDNDFDENEENFKEENIKNKDSDDIELKMLEKLL